MDWRRIPSLSALRAFDALARQGGFSAAARSLNVTHAAIAQHVRALETHFGETLAVRRGQAMELTDPGRELAAALDAGFGAIAEGVARLADRHAARPVNVTLTPSFAEAWLMPRIGGFWAEHPDIAVALNPSMALVDLRRDGFDLGIRFGNGNWPDYKVEPLDVSDFVVICAPGYTLARNMAELGDPALHSWLTSYAAAEQATWIASIGIDFAALRAREMPNNSMVLSAVKSGVGLSVQSRALVGTELARGEVVALHEGDSGGLGYYIITRPAPLTPNARVFRDWLRRAART